MFKLNKWYIFGGPKIFETCVNWFSVVVVPSITCPSNIIQDLAPGKSTADVSGVWKEPTSSEAQITVQPPEITSAYQFPLGTTKVEWTATNSAGSESCAIYVVISGKGI